MSNVGFSTLTVIPSFQGFQSKLTAGTTGPMASAGRVGGKKFGDAAGREAGDRFKSGFGSRLKGFAPLAGLGLGVGAVAFFKDAIDGASDLSESGNKINAIFGDAQAQVQAFASDASASLGQTQLQALDAASTFGTFGKAAGLSGDALAGFSTELVSLSTDMASFYNTDVTTAIEAIGSGLRGEAEPLRQFGVLLDDATLKAEALKQGLIEDTKQALTPQQKVLAAHAVILKQTTDAQGDFAKTSSGLANQQRILTAQWEEMKTKVGSELLPAVTGFVSFLSQDALPVMGELGGVVKDSAAAFNDLPGPVKASAAAFVALRIAAATGLTSTAAAGVASLSSSLVGLRLRTMMAADAFTAVRTTAMTFNGNVGTVNRGVGRLAAGMQGLKVGAAGAGTALKSGLGGAMSLLGGPWGVAMIAGTAAVAHFWAENQKAKQYVDDLTGSLDKQTGAVTANTKELVFNALQQSGAIDAAKNLGISLDDVRRAALGNEAAMTRVNAVLQDVDSTGRSLGDTGATVAIKNFFGAMGDGASDAFTLQQAIGDTTGALGQAKTRAQDFAEFQSGQAAASNGKAAESFRSLRDRINDARAAVELLANEENALRIARVQNKRDQLALITMQREAEKEAAKGVRTLDESTRAGRENWNALLDVADQWNNSSSAVTDAQGAYGRMRKNFIDLAMQMGATRDRARELADRFVKLPEEKKLEITTPGMERALADIEKLKQRLKEAGDLAIYVNTKQANDPRLSPPRFAHGGRVGGYGTGDRQLILADSREWVINPQAVNYYGNGFMDALNKMRIPRFAQGGQVGTSSPARSNGGAGVVVHIGQVVAHDYDDFMRQTQRRVRAANGGGVNF